jgi:hypothetical protein
MEKFLFDNENFDLWLTEKVDEILSKDKNDSITNKEAVILILKSQADHIKRMNDEG